MASLRKTVQRFSIIITPNSSIRSVGILALTSPFSSNLIVSATLASSMRVFRPFVDLQLMTLVSSVGSRQNVLSRYFK